MKEQLISNDKLLSTSGSSPFHDLDWLSISSVHVSKVIGCGANALYTCKYQMLQNGVGSMETKMNKSYDGKQLMKLSQLTTSHKHAVAERQHANRANAPNQDLLVCHFADVRNLVKSDLQSITIVYRFCSLCHMIMFLYYWYYIHY